MTTEARAITDTGRVLTERLEAAELRVAAAIDVIPLIYRAVEDHHSRGVVIADIVDCWLSLAPEVRNGYLLRGRGNAPVGHFGAEYAEAVTRGVPEWPPSLDILQWRIHVAAAQRRRILGEPVSPQWLAQFPVPDGSGDGDGLDVQSGGRGVGAGLRVHEGGL